MSMLLAAEVWSAVRRDLANFMAHLEPPATVLQDDAVLVLTGGPTADCPAPSPRTWRQSQST